KVGRNAFRFQEDERERRRAPRATDFAAPRPGGTAASGFAPWFAARGGVDDDDIVWERWPDDTPDNVCRVIGGGAVVAPHIAGLWYVCVKAVASGAPSGDVVHLSAS